MQLQQSNWDARFKARYVKGVRGWTSAGVSPYKTLLNYHRPPPVPPPPNSTPGTGNSKAIKQFVKGFKQKGVEFFYRSLNKTCNSFINSTSRFYWVRYLLVTTEFHTISTVGKIPRVPQNIELPQPLGTVGTHEGNQKRSFFLTCPSWFLRWPLICDIWEFSREIPNHLRHLILFPNCPRFCQYLGTIRVCPRRHL